MDGAASRELLRWLAGVATGADPAAAGQATERLGGLSGREWLRLDELARRDWPLDWVTDWRPALAGGSAAARAAASMCRDGRVREVAVGVLAWTPGPVAAAALAVRIADWVPQVSSAAMAAVAARTQDAAAIVPVMLALRQRRRGRRAAAAYLAGLAGGPAATLAVLAGEGLAGQGLAGEGLAGEGLAGEGLAGEGLAGEGLAGEGPAGQGLAGGDERGGRLWALGVMAERGLLTADGLTGRAMRDRDPVVALWCAAQLWASGGDVARLLGSARARVRAFAVDQAADDQLGRDTLRGLLADRSGAVRAAARWRWTRRWDDLGQVYRDMLAAGGPPRQVAAALYGLGEDGDGALPAVAVPFLAHPSPAVRRAAARAVGRHGAADDLVGWLAPLLQDESAKVVAEALRYLRGYALPPGVLAALDAGDTTRSRRTALSIRQRLGPWSRVHADLVAVNGEDPDLAQAARTDLLTWLRHDAMTTYGRPDAGQAAQIAALLGTGLGSGRLTGKQRREVAFAAGLRLDRG